MKDETCLACRQEDEWFCPTCRLRWACDDPEPPECRSHYDEYVIAYLDAGWPDRDAA
jgi:hypothetical protein